MTDRNRCSSHPQGTTVRGVLAFLVMSVSVVLALAFANRPRFWWQESLCNSVIYWVAPLCLSFLWNLRALVCTRSRSIVLGLTLVAQLYVLLLVAQCAKPYLVFNRWPHIDAASSASLSILYLDEWRGESSHDYVREIVQHRRPTIVIVSGQRVAELAHKLPDTQYPYRAQTVASVDGAVRIFSALPLETDMIRDLGIEAYPGGTVRVRISDTKVIELGALMLAPSFSTEQFERNRISTRRLASLMRNSDATRIVVASFNATPFSQFASIYVEQARMRSVFFGRGLKKTYNMQSQLVPLLLSNALVSRDVQPIDVERIEIPGRSRAGIFFAVRIRA